MALCSTTTPKINRPVSIICARLPATTAPIINTMASTEISGSTSMAAAVCLRNRVCATTPSTMGSSTICKMDISIVVAETSIHWLANRKNTAGVSRGASRVLIEVTATESATLPRARKVITLEAVPPGQAPTSTTPMATSGGRLRARESR